MRHEYYQRLKAIETIYSKCEFKQKTEENTHYTYSILLKLENITKFLFYFYENS